MIQDGDHDLIACRAQASDGVEQHHRVDSTGHGKDNPAAPRQQSLDRAHDIRESGWHVREATALSPVAHDLPEGCTPG
jgi:hypothetical protein